MDNRLTLRHHLYAVGIVAAWATFISASYATSSYEASLSRGRDPDWWTVFTPYFICHVAWILFTPALLYLCHRFRPRRKNWISFVAVHLIAGFGFGTLRGVVVGLAMNSLLGADNLLWGFGLSALGAFDCWFFVAVYNGLVYYRQYRRRELRASQLEAQLARAQSQVLKMQLHPHFLFNTLNAIASLNYHDVKGANRMISRLSELLRISLDNINENEVTVRDEIGLLRRYLDIEQVRFGDRLRVEIDVPPAVASAYVPKLILQPLVENAVRHGIGRITTEGRITVRAARDNGTLRIEISDNGPGLAGRAEKSGHESGMGLSITTERLEKMYGAEGRLETRSPAVGGFVARITVPYHATPLVEPDAAGEENDGDHQDDRR